jgi:aminoglycoside phosphotransferase (APT) family kinase protein
MRPHELESVAARHVPGTGELDIQFSGKGLVNETYRVLRDGRAYALRVAAANPRDLGVDRAWEARVLERACSADLAPALEYSDPQRGILIVRWVDGRSWSPVDVRRRSNLSRMAQLLRRVHALPVPAPARLMSPSTWIDYYSAAACRSAGRERGTGDSSSGAALRNASRERLAALAALPRIDPTVCHSDLHTLNLIDRGPSLVLLDWEYSHAADPLWDLASWGANNDLEDGVAHELLSNYLERTPTRDEYLRLQLLGWLYDYVCLIWSELYLNVDGDVRQADATRGGVAVRAKLLAARLAASK